MSQASGTAVANSLTGPVVMSLADLAGYLHPRVSEEQLRRIFAQLPGLNPVGTSPNSSGRGRPVDVYDAATVQEWHAANRRWLLWTARPWG
jgi:hypothetical protein